MCILFKKLPKFSKLLNAMPLKASNLVKMQLTCSKKQSAWSELMSVTGFLMFPAVSKNIHKLVIYMPAMWKSVEVHRSRTLKGWKGKERSAIQLEEIRQLLSLSLMLNVVQFNPLSSLLRRATCSSHVHVLFTAVCSKVYCFTAVKLWKGEQCTVYFSLLQGGGLIHNTCSHIHYVTLISWFLKAECKEL